MRRSLVGVLFALTTLPGGASPRAQNVVISGDFPISAPRELPKGTGLILGRVVEADSKRPVDRAIVYLSSLLGVVDPAMTDAQGRFVFRDLPKGQYQLRSVKPGYVDGAYAKRSADEELGRDGQPLTLDEDERQGDVTLPMWKHATITGTVTDETGEPVVNATVRALPRRIVAGRPLFDLGYRTQPVSTDDRGVFRLPSLPPGEYVVVVPALTGAMPKERLPAAAGMTGTPLGDSSNGGGRWFGGTASARGAGIDVGDAGFLLTTSIRTSSSFAGLTKDGKILAYTTAFYSNASSLARASVIALRSGETREGVNLQLAPVPTSRVSGTLSGPSGPASMMLRLVSADALSTTIDAEMAQTVSDTAGRFTFFGVPPGEYRIHVIHAPVTRSPPSQPGTMVQSAGGASGLTIMSGGGSRIPTDVPAEWADAPVSVGGADVNGVEVTLRTGFRIRGRVQFEGSATPPAPDRISIQIERADGREAANTMVERGAIDAQGNVVTYGQPPGSYFVRTLSAPPGWRFKGAMHGGRDVSIVPLDLSAGDVEGLTLVFTDQPANALSGTVTNARGELATTASVIVFPADRERWTNTGRTPRNLRAVAVAGAARYQLTNLPPGPYLVAATTDARPAWGDPKFLETLARTAQKVTIGDDEKRTLDLRVQGGTPAPESDSGDDELEQQAPARDAQQAPAVGSAVIAGMVTTGGERPQPLRRASVVLTGATIGGGRLAVTDDTGRFEFARLPPGRYSLNASKLAYLTMYYGATRPDRPGTQIQLADGQRLTDVVLPLLRGATISGVIRDDRGQPAAGVTVQAMWYRVSAGGERTLTRAGQALVSGTTTDDRGAYRLYGLAPGEYTVLAAHRTASGNFRMTTEADVQAAQQAVKQAAGRRGSVPAAANTGRATTPPSRGMSYSPSLYPGTSDAAAATFFTLAAGDDKTGVDFAIGFVPTATVEGTVTGPSGPLPANLEVRIVNTGTPAATILAIDFGLIFPIRPGPDGVFRFRGISPGRYAVVATTGAQTGRRGGAEAQPSAPLWATADVTVNGTDVSGLSLSLQPGMSVTGTVVYSATSLKPPDLAATRVMLAPQLTGSEISVGQLQVNAKPDGAFAVTGVMPGRYTVRVLPPTGVAGWLLSSAMLKDTDFADQPFEVRPNESISGMAITLIDQPAALSGVLQDAGGRPAPDYYVILFPADRGLWRTGSRRIVQVRPGTDGKFQFRNLVAGEYRLAAVTDVETGEWYDPAFLTQLAKASVAVTIAMGESKVQDIRIAK